MLLSAIEDVFQKLGDSALFFVMDITKGFWNVLIKQPCLRTIFLYMDFPSFSSIETYRKWLV
jgi:hypothetical protein